MTRDEFLYRLSVLDRWSLESIALPQEEVQKPIAKKSPTTSSRQPSATAGEPDFATTPFLYVAPMVHFCTPAPDNEHSANTRFLYDEDKELLQFVVSPVPKRQQTFTTTSAENSVKVLNSTSDRANGTGDSEVRLASAAKTTPGKLSPPVADGDTLYCDWNWKHAEFVHRNKTSNGLHVTHEHTLVRRSIWDSLLTTGEVYGGTGNLLGAVDVSLRVVQTKPNGKQVQREAVFVISEDERSLRPLLEFLDENVCQFVCRTAEKPKPSKFIYPGHIPPSHEARVHLSQRRFQRHRGVFDFEGEDGDSLSDATSGLVVHLLNASSSPYCLLSSHQQQEASPSCANNILSAVLKSRRQQLPLSIGPSLDRPSFFDEKSVFGAGGGETLDRETEMKRVQKLLPKLRIVVARLLRGMHRAIDVHA